MENDNIYNAMQAGFFETVDNVCRLNLHLQAAMYKNRAHLSPLHWLYELATVRISVGRQIGKTRYALSRAGLNDVIIVHNARVQASIQPDTTTNVYYPDQFIRNYNCPGMRYMNIERIFLDEAEYFRKSAVEEIYAIAARLNTRQIIILG